MKTGAGEGDRITVRQRAPVDGTGGDLRLTDVVGAAKRRSGLLILCAGLGIVAAGLFTLFSRPVYKAEAKVLLEEPSGLPSSLSSLGGIPGLASLAGASSVIAAEIERIRSRSLLRRVLAGPDATVMDDQTLVTVVLDAEYASILTGLKRKFGGSVVGAADRAGEATDLDVEVTRWNFPLDFDGLLELRFLPAGRLRIGFHRLFGQRAIEVELQGGRPVDFEQATLVLNPGADLTGRTFLVGAKTLRRTVDDLLETLVIEEKTRGSNVLGLTYYGPGPRQAAELVNRLVDEFVRSRKDLSSAESSRTIQYIQGELERIRADLRDAEQNGVRWSQAAGPIALPETARALVEGLSEIDLEQARATFAAESLSALLASIEAGQLSEDEMVAIQASQAVDPSEVESLATLLGEREALRATYNEEWPELKSVTAEIDARLAGVTQSLRGQITSERRTAADLERISEGYERELSKLPEAQLAYARHERRIQTLGEIEVFFRGQLEDARLRLAATTPNAEVLDWAVEPFFRDRPSLRTNLLVGLLIGLALGIGVGFLFEMRRPIVNAERLAEVSGAPLLGVVKFRAWQSWLPFRERPDGRAAEDLRALRLSFLQRADSCGGCASVAFVSPRRSAQRARLCANLALALVAKGERVLLVDADTRRQRASKGLGVSSGAVVGLGVEALADATHSGGVDDLDLVPLGGELSLADQADAGLMEGFLAQAHEHWERVLFDCSALEEGADALAIGRRVGGVLLVVQRGRAGEREVDAAVSALARVGATLLGVILTTG